MCVTTGQNQPWSFNQSINLVHFAQAHPLLPQPLKVTDLMFSSHFALHLITFFVLSFFLSHRACQLKLVKRLKRVRVERHRPCATATNYTHTLRLEAARGERARSPTWHRPPSPLLPSSGKSLAQHESTRRIHLRLVEVFFSEVLVAEFSTPSE